MSSRFLTFLLTWVLVYCGGNHLIFGPSTQWLPSRKSAIRSEVQNWCIEQLVLMGPDARTHGGIFKWGNCPVIMRIPTVCMKELVQTTSLPPLVQSSSVRGHFLGQTRALAVSQWMFNWSAKTTHKYTYSPSPTSPEESAAP